MQEILGEMVIAFIYCLYEVPNIFHYGQAGAGSFPERKDKGWVKLNMES